MLAIHQAKDPCSALAPVPRLRPQSADTSVRVCVFLRDSGAGGIGTCPNAVDVAKEQVGSKPRRRGGGKARGGLDRADQTPHRGAHQFPGGVLVSGNSSASSSFKAMLALVARARTSSTSASFSSCTEAAAESSWASAASAKNWASGARSLLPELRASGVLPRGCQNCR